jgi:hypothetical protein
LFFTNFDSGYLLPAAGPGSLPTSGKHSAEGNPSRRNATVQRAAFCGRICFVFYTESSSHLAKPETVFSGQVRLEKTRPKLPVPDLSRRFRRGFKKQTSLNVVFQK